MSSSDPVTPDDRAGGERVFLVRTHSCISKKTLLSPPAYGRLLCFWTSRILPGIYNCYPLPKLTVFGFSKTVDSALLLDSEVEWSLLGAPDVGGRESGGERAKL